LVEPIKVLQRRLKLQATTTHKSLNSEHQQLILACHLSRCVENRRPVHHHPIICDEFDRLGLVARQASSDERSIDATRLRHASGAKHQIGETSEIVEYSVWRHSAVIGRLAHTRQHQGELGSNQSSESAVCRIPIARHPCDSKIINSEALTDQLPHGRERFTCDDRPNAASLRNSRQDGTAAWNEPSRCRIGRVVVGAYQPCPSK
jgi:hypothetical protein